MKKILFILFVSLLCLAGCSSYSQDMSNTDFYAGEELTPEDISSIAESIEAAKTEKYPQDTDAKGELIVYWTESGKVWHLSRECGTLKRSSSVIEGCELDAINAGKERVCSICSK